MVAAQGVHDMPIQFPKKNTAPTQGPNQQTKAPLDLPMNQPSSSTSSLLAGIKKSAQLPTPAKASPTSTSSDIAYSNITLDDDVPIPPLRRGGRVSKYPFAEMLPMGQGKSSFEVKGVTVQQIHGSIQNFRKRFPDWEFTVRSMPDGVRVWRTK
jgi:hypothetical protein